MGRHLLQHPDRRARCGSERDRQPDLLGRTVRRVRADGTFASPAADLAEMLPASQALEPGDVLVIGSDGKLARSTKPYEATVVGVYSTKPAFLGGTSDTIDAAPDKRLVDAKTGKQDMTQLGADGDIPLAVSGVVPVKVSDENGPILPGDLLVASSTPGYAMRAGASAPQGTVIGKALAALEKRTGTIKMLTTFDERGGALMKTRTRILTVLVALVLLGTTASASIGTSASFGPVAAPGAMSGGRYVLLDRTQPVSGALTGGRYNWPGQAKQRRLKVAVARLSCPVRSSR